MSGVVLRSTGIAFSNMAFCGPCEDIFTSQPVSIDKNYDHHRTWHGFLEAADQGCSVCWRKLDTLPTDHQALLRQLSSEWDRDLSTQHATTIRFSMDSAGCLYMAFWCESSQEYLPFPDRQECPDPRYFLSRRLRTFAFVPSGKIRTHDAGYLIIGIRIR